jgi:hypothetical protein
MGTRRASWRGTPTPLDGMGWDPWRRDRVHVRRQGAGSREAGKVAGDETGEGGRDGVGRMDASFMVC